MASSTHVESNPPQVDSSGKFTKEGSLSSPKSTEASSSTKLPPTTDSVIHVYNGFRQSGEYIRISQKSRVCRSDGRLAMSFEPLNHQGKSWTAYWNVSVTMTVKKVERTIYLNCGDLLAMSNGNFHFACVLCKPGTPPN